MTTEDRYTRASARYGDARERSARTGASDEAAAARRERRERRRAAAEGGSASGARASRREQTAGRDRYAADRYAANDRCAFGDRSSGGRTSASHRPSADRYGPAGRPSRDLDLEARSAERRARRVRDGRDSGEPGPRKPIVQTFKAPSAASGIADALRSHVVLVLVILAIVLTPVILFRPVQTYYRAWRSQMDLQSEYDFYQAQNDGLKGDISRLQSREGIEAEARERGYGYEGESVTGSSAGSAADAGSSAEKFNILDVERPWYVHLGDYVFGYMP